MSAEATAPPVSLPGPMLPRFDVVFIDMDGVLADFQGAACKVHNKLSVAELVRLKHWEPQEWLMWKVFGISAEKFWMAIDNAPEFWHHMPKTPFCDAIVTLARGLSDTVRILSTPNKTEACYAGKKYWCWHNVPGYKITLNEDEDGRSSKELLAKPGRLLLDDSDKNCNAFREAGGDAILIPAHWNSAHAAAPFGPLFYLAQELEKIRQRQERKEAAVAKWDAIKKCWKLTEPSTPIHWQIKVDGWPEKPAADQSIGTQDTSDAPPVPSPAPVPPPEPDWPLANPTPPAGYGPGTNTGHGYAWPRPDGSYAKCCGYSCQKCIRDSKYFLSPPQFADILADSPVGKVLAAACQIPEAP